MNPEPITLCDLPETRIEGVESFSPFCLKVHRALRAAGLPYQTRREDRPDAYKHLNPAAQVPVLLVGDDAVSDSTRILERIESLAPGSMQPRDPRAAAESWLWEDWADRALNGYVVAARWADDRNWPLVRDAYFGTAPWFVRTLIAPRIRNHVLAGLRARDFLRHGNAALWSDFRRVLDLLEARAPERAYWTGERLSAADFALFGQLHALRTPLTPTQARELKLRPKLTDWLDRVDSATRRSLHVAVDRAAA